MRYSYGPVIEFEPPKGTPGFEISEDERIAWGLIVDIVNRAVGAKRTTTNLEEALESAREMVEVLAGPAPFAPDNDTTRACRTAARMFSEGRVAWGNLHGELVPFYRWWGDPATSESTPSEEV